MKNISGKLSDKNSCGAENFKGGVSKIAKSWGLTKKNKWKNSLFNESFLQRSAKVLKTSKERPYGLLSIFASMKLFGTAVKLFLLWSTFINLLKKHQKLGIDFKPWISAGLIIHQCFFAWKFRLFWTRSKLQNTIVFSQLFAKRW